MVKGVRDLDKHSTKCRNCKNPTPLIEVAYGDVDKPFFSVPMCEREGKKQRKKKRVTRSTWMIEIKQVENQANDRCLLSINIHFISRVLSLLLVRILPTLNYLVNI